MEGALNIISFRREGEKIAILTWSHIGLDHKTLTIVDSKNKSKNRTAFMTTKVAEMLHS